MIIFMIFTLINWSLENLKELAKYPQYKKRIEEHLSQLNLSISNREKELQVLNKLICSWIKNKVIRY